MGETSWAAAINNAKENLTDSDIRVWEKHSIFRVPTYLMPEPNYKAYKPLVVSIGPFHHGEKQLLPMEEHKRRALICLLKETDKVVEDYMEALRPIRQQLMDAYEHLDWSWREGNFLKMMVLDGCFMIQIFRSTVPEWNFHHDGVFNPAWQSSVIPLIKRDMLLIENQLPLLALQMLADVALTEDQGNINSLLLRFCFPSEIATYMGPGLHMLDVVRCSMLQRPPVDSGTLQNINPSTLVCPGNLRIRYSGKGNWPSTKLDSFITFKKSRTNNLDDITFNGHYLYLPCITIEHNSESIFLNFIAFEQLCCGTNRFFTSFCSLMVSIITSPEDVSFLSRKGFIEMLAESNIEVAAMIKKLSMVPFFSGDNNTLDQVQQDLNFCCMQKRITGCYDI